MTTNAGIRCAIILETEGRRIIYEVQPEALTLDQDELLSWSGSRIHTTPQRITLEGVLLHGTIWDGPMPAQTHAELEAPTHAITT